MPPGRSDPWPLYGQSAAYLQEIACELPKPGPRLLFVRNHGGSPRYRRSLRIVASLAGRISKDRCVVLFGAVGMIPQLDRVSGELRAFKDLIDVLQIRLKTQKSKAGTGIEFSGVTIRLPKRGSDAIAQHSPPRGRAYRLAQIATWTRVCPFFFC